MTDAKTQLQQTIETLLADIEGRKQAKIDAANKEADDEIGAIIARLQEPVSLLPLIHTETASAPGATLAAMFEPTAVTVPPMPSEPEAGD